MPAELFGDHIITISQIGNFWMFLLISCCLKGLGFIDMNLLYIVNIALYYDLAWYY
jgi:hypothetical protein